VPAEDEANADDALVQFELYEVLVRLAFAKFINSKEMNDASDALDRLMEEHVLSNVPEEVLVDPNEFRFNRMYTEEVEELLLKHDDFLQAIFQVLNLARIPALWCPWKPLQKSLTPEDLCRCTKQQIVPSSFGLSTINHSLMCASF
jgi:hypothetical protein